MKADDALEAGASEPGLRRLSSWLFISFLASLIGCSVKTHSEERYHVDKRAAQTPPPDSPPYQFDLDGDGVNDTNLDVRPCTDDPLHYCLNVDSAIMTPRQIPLGDGAFPLGSPPADIGDNYRPTVMGVTIEVIGDYSDPPDGISEVSLLYLKRNTHTQPSVGDHMTPALAVFDVVARQPLGATTAPPSLGRFLNYNLASWTDYPRDPSGHKHPFLAPGYGDERYYVDATTYWGYLCVFRPESGAQGRCGTGFAEASAVPSYTDPSWIGTWGSVYYFREVGGNVVPDFTADRWDTIYLIYHGSIVSISPRTAQQIVTTTFNVAGPGGGWFHSGRLYGVHTAVNSTDGKLRDIILGGIPVGIFSDAFCNVSRFVTVLESNPGQPSTMHMAWTYFFGFHSNGYDPNYPCPNPRVTRAGQFSHGCVERFSDGRSSMDGQPVIIVNYFNQRQGVSQCVTDQACGFPLSWPDCYNSNLRSRGNWSMQVFGERDGAMLTGSGQAYVWGWSDRIFPYVEGRPEPIYLTEATAADVSFDLSDVPQTPLTMRGLRGGSWVFYGNSPVPGRPRIGYPPWGGMGGPRGEGSFTAYAELNLYDVDGDGLLDVLLEDNTWIGWSDPTSISGVWEVKRYGLTIDLAGQGAGSSSVSSDPAGLSCSGVRCSGSFVPGTQLNLQPAPGSGYRFINFTGDPGCGDRPVVMNRSRRCTANFAAATSVVMRQIATASFGSGADGTATVSTAVNINAQTLGSVSRTFADGIAYPVSSDPTGQTTIRTAVNPDGIAAGDMILLIDLQGAPISSVGYYDVLGVTDVSANAITVSSAPTHTYTGGSFGSQKVVVQRIPQYSDMTILSGGLVTAGAWDGLAPQPGGRVNTGIVAFAVQGSLAIDPGGGINVNLLGYRGAPSESLPSSPFRLNGLQGEGLCGVGNRSTAENCGAGGGGTTSLSGGWWGAQGGGGGHATVGEMGSRDGRDRAPVTTPGSGGARFGSTDLSDQLFFGGAGGAGGNYDNGLREATAPGGRGGGIVLILARNISNQGEIQSDGEQGGWVSNTLSGGAGAGGSLLIEGFDVALGNNTIHAHASSTHLSGAEVATRYSSVGTLSVFYINSVSGSVD